jgi:hypothetical protein
MIGLWRVAVSVALGAIVAVVGYNVWQTRNLDDAWGFALLGALIGLAVGLCGLQLGENSSAARGSSTKSSGRQGRPCYGTLDEPHEEAAAVNTDGSWRCSVCHRQL